MLFEFKILKYTHLFTVFHTLVRLYFICVSVSGLETGKRCIKIFPQGGIPKLKYMYPIFTIANAATISLLQVIPNIEAVIMDSSGLWINQENSLIAAEISVGCVVRSKSFEFKEILNNSCEDLWSFFLEKSTNKNTERAIHANV